MMTMLDYESLSVEDKYPLFAITNDKKIKKEFESCYNMKQFKRMVTELTEDEYVDFAMRNRGKVLEMYEFTGVNNHWKKNQETFTITLPITFVIKQHIEDMAYPGTNQDLWIDDYENYINPTELNEEYTKPLLTLGYFAAYDNYFGGIDRYGWDLISSFPMFEFNSFDYFCESERWLFE